MSASPQPLPVPERNGRVDLDELFRDAKPIGDGADWAAPGVFETDDELEDFLAWLHADRASGIA
ncbi:MAG: hypothetical protein QM582_17940 [Micropruina sp.]|uniref:hypothetical protein n=1 Tax=Micropruina sp. TaxID=2737536 RepID=UPI0039E2ACD6